jgi:hypothetical protein
LNQPTANPAVEAVRAKALAAWKPGLKYAFATDPNTYGRGKRPSVLIAIVTRAGSIVVAMDNTDWVDPTEPAAEMILEFIGCTRPTVIDTATAAKAAALKK